MAVKELIGPNKKAFLVTSAYHMYRAKKLFNGKGFDVIPYKGSRNNETEVMDLLPDAESLKLTDTGIREIIGRMYYFLKL